MSTPLHVLILEDRSADVELMLHELRRAGFSPDWQQVETEPDFLACLDPALEVILADYTLPQFDAMRALHLLQARGLDVPFIVVTGSISEEVAVACMKQGVADYLLKDRLARLGPAVRRALEQKQAHDEKRRAEAALRESEQRYRRLVELSPDGIAVLSQDKLIFVNSAGARLLGVATPEALIGQPILDFVHPDDWELARERIQQLLAGNASLPPLELKVIRLDGTVITVEVVGKLFLHQERPAAQVVVRDITERKQREHEQEVIATVAFALRTATTRAEMQPVILGQLIDLLKADGAALTMHDTASGKPVVELARSGAVKPSDLDLLPSEGVIGHVIATGQPYVTDDPQSDPRFHQAGLFGEAHAVACVPLIAQEQTIGALWVSRKTTLTGEEVRLLKAVADITASAIYRATLYEETQRYVQRLAALRNIDVAITASTDLDITLNVFLDQVISQLGADAADVLLLNPETQTLEHAAGRGFRTGTAARIPMQLGVSYAGRAALEGGVINIPNLATVDDLKGLDLRVDEGFVSYHAVPFITKGRVEGVLEIFHRTPLDPTSEWLDFLEALAAQAAIAIENARLFAETRSLLQQAQEQARQVQHIVDTMPNGVLLLDDGRRIALANPIAQEYLALLGGVEVGDVLTHLGGRPAAELLQSPPGGLWYELEVAGPPHRLFEVDARPLETGPEASGWVLVIRDVTREREIQQRSQRQDRLAAVGQLAAGIAHDFNNILTGIIGFAELARYQPGSAESLDRDLERIIEQGGQAAHLIRQVLDFSRQSVAEKGSLELVSLVEETIELLERTIPEDIRIVLDVEGEHEAYRVEANPAQIQQMLTNLAVNARDAMSAGGVLQIRLSRLTLMPGERLPGLDLPPGDWIVIVVSDTGVGIPPEALLHIFEPFFTTKEVGKGTGLGLAQVYGIVKQHGGDIDVESRPGQGTTFTLYLPVSSPSGKRPHQPIEEGALPHGYGELILLVEDDSATLNVIKAMLEHLGYQILTAGNGRHALEVYDDYRGEIALVLTDVTMPEMGGVALSRTLQERDPAIKVVAMTGYPLEIEAKGLLSQGVMEWLQKPLNLEKLAWTVRQVLQG